LTSNHWPPVVVKGRGEVGRRIIEAARANGVPLEANPALAEALAQVELEHAIPEALYRAVAECSSSSCVRRASSLELAADFVPRPCDPLFLVFRARAVVIFLNSCALTFAVVSVGSLVAAADRHEFPGAPITTANFFDAFSRDVCPATFSGFQIAPQSFVAADASYAAAHLTFSNCRRAGRRDQRQPQSKCHRRDGLPYMPRPHLVLPLVFWRDISAARQVHAVGWRRADGFGTVQYYRKIVSG
jgi:type III secretion system FlhB-like substrate exporter